MELALYLGITAGLLQALGYFLYVFMTIWREVRPNASTWFMFAYGTSLLTILEFEQDASWALLIVPITCATLGVCVALICWARGTLRWPESRIDQASFIVDLILTVCYVSVWLLRSQGVLNEDQTWYAVLGFLLLSNFTAFSSFTPIIRETYLDPGHERSEPWVVWTLAYVLLGAVTILEEGVWTGLILYPVINAPLHATVAWLARPSRQRRLKASYAQPKAALSFP